MRTRIRLAVAVVLAVSVLAADAFAQSSTLTVQAIDRTSAVLPGATVTVTPVSDCGESRTPMGAATIATTDGRQGVAAFSTVEHQTYRVEARLTYFTTEATCIRFERAEPNVRITLAAGLFPESVTSPGSSPVVDIQPRTAPPREELLPMNSMPQSVPCADQPKTLGALKAAFNEGKIPSPAETTGEWVAISFFGDNNAYLNCTGFIRGTKFEQVMIADQYSLAIRFIGAQDVTLQFAPDRTGSLAFPIELGGDASPGPVYRCRMTNRKTLACLIDIYREGVEFKKMRVTPNQIRVCLNGRC